MISTFFFYHFQRNFWPSFLFFSVYRSDRNQFQPLMLQRLLDQFFWPMSQCSLKWRKKVIVVPSPPSDAFEMIPRNFFFFFFPCHPDLENHPFDRTLYPIMQIRPAFRGVFRVTTSPQRFWRKNFSKPLQDSQNCLLLLFCRNRPNLPHISVTFIEIIPSMASQWWLI